MRNRNIPQTRRPRHQLVIISLDTPKSFLAEFISTFIFVFAATGSRIAVRKLNLTAGEAAFGLISEAIAYAFSLAVAVYVGTKFGALNPYVLCGHVNPAVTFGAFMGGNIHFIRGIIYWISQVLASVAACGLLIFVTGGKSIPVYGLSNGVGVENALVLEIVMTFGLVFTMCATVYDPKARGYTEIVKTVINDQDVLKLIRKPSLNKIAPLAIGLIAGANVLVGGPFDGACMNPALSFGPAILNWSWDNHWVYWVGPFIGAGLAGFFHDFIFISY